MFSGCDDRDAATRLGANGAGDVRNHPFLSDNVEWGLLAQQKLVPPFVPVRAAA